MSTLLEHIFDEEGTIPSRRDIQWIEDNIQAGVQQYEKIYGVPPLAEWIRDYQTKVLLNISVPYTIHFYHH